MNFENSLTYLLIQTSNFYRNSLQKLMNEINLHSGQVFVLISLWENDGQSQIDLAKALGLTAPTINKMVKSLMAGGFVECRKCEIDSRMMRVYLTDKGLQSRLLVEKQWRKLEDESFSDFTPTEKLMILHLFEKLQKNLKSNIADRTSDL